MTEQSAPPVDRFLNAPVAIKLGRWLFKRRDYTPIPVILVAVFFATPSWISLATAFVCICIGEWIRIWGISYIGGVSRIRSDNTGKLISSGPFGRMRNPLYVGNFLISTGVFIATGLWIYLPAFICLFAFQYHYIVLYEEFNLIQRYGDQYRRFMEKVPRWLPVGPGGVDSENPIASNLNKALKSERNTFLAIVVLSGIFVTHYLFLHGHSLFLILSRQF